MQYAARLILYTFTNRYAIAPRAAHLSSAAMGCRTLRAQDAAPIAVLYMRRRSSTLVLPPSATTSPPLFALRPRAIASPPHRTRCLHARANEPRMFCSLRTPIAIREGCPHLDWGGKDGKKWCTTFVHINARRAALMWGGCVYPISEHALYMLCCML